jgi:hypothetical protein
LTPFQANVPVVLQGVGVMPGRYVSAYSSGAVVIPDGHLEEVLVEARKVEAADAASRDQIARERVRVNDHSASNRRARSTRGAPFARGCERLDGQLPHARSGRLARVRAATSSPLVLCECGSLDSCE